MRRAVIAALTILLASCLGPPYQRPQVAAPAQWEQTPMGVRTQQAPAAIQWWSSFGDATLDSLIHDALSNNYDLRAAAARLREARALRGITASRGKPQVDGSAIASRSRHGNDFFDAAFDASWELDLFGGIRRDVEAAIAQVEASDESRLDLELSLAAEIARNYVELRGAQRRLDVLDARIQTLRDTLDMVRARQEGGLTNDLDVARSQALLEDTLAARPSLEYASTAAMHRLAVLTGRPPAHLTEQLAPHSNIPAAPKAIAIGTPVDLVSRRPDVRRAERELAAATARIDVARADLYPRVALLGAFGRRSDDSVTETYGSFGPALRWPLLTGGRVHAQIDAQRARRDQAEAAFHQSVLRAMEDVENSLASYGRDQRERDRLAEAVTAEARAVELAGACYRAGLDSFLAVLDAQRTLRDGEDRLAGAETRVAVSAVALCKALGGGL